MNDFNWLGALLFFFIILGTPGPAVISLLHSGSNYGFKASLPYLLGIITGFAADLLLSAFGIGMIQKHPQAYQALQYLMLGYLLYLAYRIASSPPPQENKVQPMHFFEGVVFNLLNPKSHLAAASAFSQFSLPENRASSILLAAIGLSAVVVTQTTWCLLGDQAKRLLLHPKWRRPLNYGLAALLLLSVAPAYCQRLSAAAL